MTNKPYHENDHTEYKITDDHEVNPAEGGVQPTFKKRGIFPMKSKFKPKVVIATVGVILIAGLVYHAVHQAAKPTPVMHSELPPIVPQKKVMAPVVLSAPVSDVQTKQMETNAKAIDQLQKMALDNQKELMSLQQSVTQVTQQLNSLSVATEALSQTVANQIVAKEKKIENAKVAEEKKNEELRRQTQYYVQAVVPGRVWLKSINGKAITVTVGDSLPGYGKVLTIDPYSGAVSTSSGVTIQYAVNES
jgi:intracellular multiplication protein IcmG